MPIREDGTSIVVLTYNSMSTIEACTESIWRTMGPEDELIIVDNGSRDATRTWLKEIASYHDRTKIILSDNNLGFSGGCNLGILESNKAYICLLNPDTVVTTGWLERMTFHFLAEDVAAVGPVSDAVMGFQQIQRHLPPDFPSSDDYERVSAKLDELYPYEASDTKLLIGFCALWRREVLDKLGLLDVELFLGADDFDLSWRARLNGYRLLIARNSFVHHVNHVSFLSEPEAVTNPLTQKSIDHLTRKLIKHYGLNGVPSQTDLWGFECFTSSIPVRSSTNVGGVLEVGFQSGNNPALLWSGAGAGITWAFDECFPSHPEVEQLFGCGQFREVHVREVLEFSPDIASVMESLTKLVAPGGKLVIRIPHHLAPDSWQASEVRHIFSAASFRVFAERPDLFDFEGYGLDAGKTNYQFTPYGSQLYFNQAVTLDEVVETPRAVEWVDLEFFKIAPSPMARVRSTSEPDVSVVFPAYKRPALVGRQIDAILNQTFTNFEVFLIGDACPEFAERLNDRYFQAKVQWARDRGIRIHAFNLSENHGSPDAIINHVIKHGAAPYLMFCGDDDYVPPQHVGHYLSAIQGSDWDVVIFDSVLIGDFYMNIRKSRMELGHVGHSEIIVKMEAARKTPPHKSGAFQDWEFISALSQFAKVAKANEASPTYQVNLTSRIRHMSSAA